LDPEAYQRIRDLFLAAGERPADEWSRFLDEQCAGNPELRAEVEALLAESADANSFLDSPILGGGVIGEQAAEAPGLPERIGPYRILGWLGEGGMGVVYRAEQTDPRRAVALKVIRPGVETERMLARFRYEAQVLGLLQHPGIAQIFEAGSAETEQGPRPFFAMELVEGQPLTAWADEQKLGTRARLELLARVCDAVQHAHQKGVIHRDLKPGNILVDRSGQPKILDFGVARATDADIRTTMQTATGQLIGTIAYMSPEQVSGDSGELDTRSDVYALGVIAYELIGGRLPHDIAGKTLPQALRVIGDQEPARLSSVNRVFRGDLETIVGKGLAREKERRYQAASDLADDIRRYLDDQPISARPATTLYQLRTFARRNKALAAVVVVAFIALVATLGHMTWQRNRALAAEKRAAEQAAIATEVNRFLNEELLAAAGPLRASDKDITVRQVLDAAAAEVEGSFEGQPAVAASVRDTLALTYKHLGEFETAEAHFLKAVRLYGEAPGDWRAERLDVRNELGVLYKLQGRYEVAESLDLEVLEGKRALYGDRHLKTSGSMTNLAAVYHAMGRHAEAELLYLEALEVRRELLGVNDEETLIVQANLANLYHDMGRYEDALAMHLETLEVRRRVLGDDHVRTVRNMNALAKVHLKLKEYDEAELLWLEVVEARRRTLGEKHPDTLLTMNNLAALYKELERYDEAEAMFVQVLAGQREALGPEHAYTLVTANNLADTYRRMGRGKEGAALFAETIATSRRALPENHWYLGVFLAQYGVCLQLLERYGEAEAALVEACDALTASLGADHPRTASTVEALAGLYDAWGKPGKAAACRESL